MNRRTKGQIGPRQCGLLAALSVSGASHRAASITTQT